MGEELTRGDLGQIRMAIQDRWPIDPEKRAEILAKVDEILAKDGAKPREVLAAARVYLAADRINLEGEIGDERAIDVRISLAEERSRALDETADSETDQTLRE